MTDPSPFAAEIDRAVARFDFNNFFAKLLLCFS